MSVPAARRYYTAVAAIGAMLIGLIGIY